MGCGIQLLTFKGASPADRCEPWAVLRMHVEGREGCTHGWCTHQLQCHVWSMHMTMHICVQYSSTWPVYNTAVHGHSHCGLSCLELKLQRSWDTHKIVGYT